MEASRYSEALEALDVLMRSSTARAVRCLRHRALPRHLRHRANGHDSNAEGGGDGGGGGAGGGDKALRGLPLASHHMSPPSAPLRREEEVVGLCLTYADVLTCADVC